MNGIKLIACDFDGTLLRSDKTLSARSMQISKKCEAAGVIFTLATGRMFRTIEPYARQLGVAAPIIAYNGAYIADQQELLYCQTFKENTARAILTLFHKNGWNLLSFANDELHTDKVSPIILEYYIKNLDIPFTEYGDSFWREYFPTPKYLSCVLSHEQADEMSAALRTTVGDQASWVYTWPHFQIMAPGVNKAAGLRVVAGYYGVDMSEVAAFGDEANDIEMIAEAGFGCAVGNASPELLEVCDAVTASNDDDGVALKIDELLERNMSGQRI